MPKTLKLKAGELARTSLGQVVTVHAITGNQALIQYANNRERFYPVTELSPLGPKAEPIPVSAFRIPLALKLIAAERAEREGLTLTSVIVDFLEKYVAGPEPERKQ